MRQPGQLLMFNDIELSLIKNTFSENDELLYMIRKVFLQFELTEDERKILKQIINKEVYAVIKKRILPVVEADSPMGNMGDLYQTLSNDLKVKGVDEMAPLFEAKQVEIDYLTQQLKVLKDVEKPVPILIKLDDLADLNGKSPEQRFIDTTARNFLLGYIDPMLTHLKTLAGQKKETLEETKKRLERDSNK